MSYATSSCAGDDLFAVTLDGPRVHLRVLRTPDMELYRRVFSDPVTMRHLADLIPDGGEWTLEAITARHEGKLAPMRAGRSAAFAVYVRCPRETTLPRCRDPIAAESMRCLGVDETHGHSDEHTGQQPHPRDLLFAGTAGFNEIDPANRNANAGIVLHHPFEGAGIATETLFLLFDFGFRRLGLHRIEMETARSNSSMCGWAQRVAGVEPECVKRQFLWDKRSATWEDLVCFAIFRPEWEVDEVREGDPKTGEKELGTARPGPGDSMRARLETRVFRPR